MGAAVLITYSIYSSSSTSSFRLLLRPHRILPRRLPLVAVAAVVVAISSSSNIPTFTLRVEEKGEEAISMARLRLVLLLLELFLLLARRVRQFWIIRREEGLLLQLILVLSSAVNRLLHLL